MDGTASSLWKCREPELMNLGRAPNPPGPWCGGRGIWVGRIWLTAQWKWQSLECRRFYHICQCLHLGGATVRELRSLWIRSGRFFFIRTEVFLGFTCSLSLAACPDEILIMQLQSDLNHSQKKSAACWIMVRIPSLRRQRFEIVQCIISPDTGKLAENNEQAVYCGVWKKNWKNWN